MYHTFSFNQTFLQLCPIPKSLLIVFISNLKWETVECGNIEQNLFWVSVWKCGVFTPYRVNGILFSSSTSWCGAYFLYLTLSLKILNANIKVGQFCACLAAQAWHAVMALFNCSQGDIWSTTSDHVYLHCYLHVLLCIFSSGVAWCLGLSLTSGQFLPGLLLSFGMNLIPRTMSQILLYQNNLKNVKLNVSQ